MRAPLLVVVALGVISCAPTPSSVAEPQAVVFVGGEEHGYLEPCGCTRPQLGGLARKASAVRGGPLLENGDLVTTGGRLSELKFETFLLALSEIGCLALNVGEGELALGLDYLRSARDLATFPLISANLRDTRGERPFPPAVQFTVGTVECLAIGVLDPDLAPEHDLGDPGEAIREALAGVMPEVFVIVLYHGSQAGARGIARRFSHVAAVAYAHGSGEPEIHSDRLFSAGDRSRWVIRSGRPATVVEMSEDLPNDPAMERSLRTYVRRLTEEDLLHRLNPMAAPIGEGYAGDAACATCHESSAASHERSRHARAIESLAKTGREVDPDCVGCHVIGYGLRTGFTSIGETPALARVGCESCHGPAADHARDGRHLPLATARESCLRCHTADTDPGFTFEKKWPKIRHP
jgi:Cytochrome c554 and c-prime